MVETGIFEPSVGELAGREGQVVGLEDADDLLAGDARRGELVRVERDEEALLETAGQVGAGDALDASDLRDDLGPGDLGDAVEAAASRSRRSTR